MNEKKNHIINVKKNNWDVLDLKYKVKTVWKSNIVIIVCKFKCKLKKISQYIFKYYDKNENNKLILKEDIKFEFNEKIKSIIWDKYNWVIFCYDSDKWSIFKIIIYDLNLKKWEIKFLSERLLNTIGFNVFVLNEEYYAIYNSITVNNYNCKDYKEDFYNNFILINKYDFKIYLVEKIKNPLPILDNLIIFSNNNSIYMMGKNKIKKNVKNSTNNKIYNFKINNLKIDEYQEIEINYLNNIQDYDYEIKNDNIYFFGGFHFKNNVKKYNKYIIHLNLNCKIINKYKVILNKKEYIISGYFSGISTLILIIKKINKYILKIIDYNFNNEKFKWDEKNMKKCDICNENYNEKDNSYFFNNILFKNINFENILNNSIILSKSLDYPFLCFKNIMNLFKSCKQFELIKNINLFQIKVSSVDNIDFIYNLIKNHTINDKFIYFLSNLYYLSQKFEIYINQNNNNLWSIKIINSKILIEDNISKIDFNSKSNLTIDFEAIHWVKEFKFIEKDILLLNNYINMPNNLINYIKLNFLFKKPMNLYLNNLKINLLYKNNLINSFSKIICNESRIIKKLYYRNVINQNYNIISVFNLKDYIGYVICKPNYQKYYILIILNDIHLSFYNNKLSKNLIKEIYNLISIYTGIKFI